MFAAPTCSPARARTTETTGVSRTRSHALSSRFRQPGSGKFGVPPVPTESIPRAAVDAAPHLPSRSPAPARRRSGGGPGRSLAGQNAAAGRARDRLPRPRGRVRRAPGRALRARRRRAGRARGLGQRGAGDRLADAVEQEIAGGGEVPAHDQHLGVEHVQMSQRPGRDRRGRRRRRSRPPAAGRLAGAGGLRACPRR